MGCTSTLMIESRKVVPLPPQTINAYIDKFPAIILLKIKEKFDALVGPDKDLTLQPFLKLYSNSKNLQRRLFVYFTDGQDSIKFRQFMVKYAIIIKCECKIFCNILFELYKENIDRDQMNQVQFSSFVESETQRLKKQANLPNLPLCLQGFTEWVIQSQLDVESYQNDLLITTEQDLPFQLINKELAQSDYNDFILGNEYYLLSNAWYYRWAFYYQDNERPPDLFAIRSTKMLPSDSFGRRFNKRRDSIKTNDSVRSSQVGTALVEQPRNIEFQDIEGEYRYQLKQNLKISAQVKVVSQTLWKLLTNLHPAEQTFKRKAVTADNLQYYPKAVYYIETDEKGKFLGETLQIKLLSHTQRVFSLKGKYSAVFVKNFGEQWKQVEKDQNLAMVSLQARFFLAVTPNRTNFLQNTGRKQINHANLHVGDKVFAPFALGGSAEAEILEVRDQHMFKVHFKGYSYRYEYEVHREDLSIMPVKDLPKRKTQGILKGIANVGNTCFINSILQCLVATPVLQDFLKNYTFSEKKEPIGYALSSIARTLLNNERPSPQLFKKMIDSHLPQFSGFDQHDAQEFLNALLDKLNEEIAEKPTVIQNLFGGKLGSQLTCCSCAAVKNIQQKMYILSLPIPEAEYNYFSIMIVPVTSKVVSKVVFKLPRTALVADYCTAFDERSGASRKDFLFVETLFGSLKKVKTQITNPLLQNKNATQVGILPNIALLAFEKMPFQFYLQLLNNKNQTQFKDFQHKPQAAWTICKIIEQKNGIKIQYISAEGEIEKISMDNAAFAEKSGKLGSKSDISYKKIILRKYNISLKRLQNFGIQLLAGVPKWASYNDLLTITDKYMLNFKKDLKQFAEQSQSEYVVKFLDPTKGKCVFCEKQSLSATLEKDDVRVCCEVSEKDVPIAWVAKSKNFWFYVDWIDLTNCHTAFSTVIDIDPVSKALENSRQEVAISLQACMKLHSEAQKVEMECDRCKEKYQKLEHNLPAMPNILVVHMKEFRYTSQGHLVKLDVRLKWQEFLDAKHALSGGKIYQLYALVKHSGSSQSGHYTCMAKRKHPIQNRKVWVHFDDHNATVTRQQEKYIDEAYLLFYKKVDMPSSSLVIYSDLNSH